MSYLSFGPLRPGFEHLPAHREARYAWSYVAVALASCVGFLLPGAAAVVLGPALLVGLVGLGLSHGACDQLVLPAYRVVRGPWWRYLLLVGTGYLGLAGAAGLVWWWPAGAVGLFFAVSSWRWGSADAPAYAQRFLWLAHSLLRGMLLLALPAWAWPSETLAHVNGLLTLAGAAPVAAGHWLGAVTIVALLVLGGYLLL